ncbi:MAG: response regulator [Desulfobacterales bacterium]
MASDTKREKKDEILNGSETVLLVDDEEMVLDVSRELLEGLGYSVETAGSGSAALEILEAKTDAIDLVILDFTMPEMGGEETFRHLKSIRPDVPVLVSSGFSLNVEVREILRHERTGFIQKPFRLHTLSQKVREILDA